MALAESKSSGVEYFAFVESIDELPRTDGGPLPPEWLAIIERREQEGLAAATHSIWLDCVQSDYFLSLEWRGERCDPGDPEQREARRALLRGLDRDRFSVVLLLLSLGTADEGEVHEQLGQAAWHVVELDGKTGIPVAIGVDFDAVLDAPSIGYLQYLERCRPEPLKQLVNVFSLDFVADAAFDAHGNEPPISQPLWPKEGGGLEQEFIPADLEDAIATTMTLALKQERGI